MRVNVFSFSFIFFSTISMFLMRSGFRMVLRYGWALWAGTKGFLLSTLLKYFTTSSSSSWMGLLERLYQKVFFSLLDYSIFHPMFFISIF